MTEWLERLRDHGAIQAGHFRLSSGLHSPQYVQCARLLEHPAAAAAAAEALVRRLGERVSPPPTTVVSPAIGGIVAGYEVARAWGARALWAERDPAGDLAFRRGFRLEPGERVAAVEDVVTTAGSLRELVRLVEATGARIVAVAALVDRSGGSVEWNVPWASLVSLDAVQVEPAACPQCAEGRPVVKPGSRPGAAPNGSAG